MNTLFISWILAVELFFSIAIMKSRTSLLRVMGKPEA